MTHDLVIRGGTVFDGSGLAPREADLAIEDGRITVVGRVSGRGRDEIDARGRMVTPGFVDIHTHYDGQVTWASRVDPSSQHGVTTVVTGNCGVGFAPCLPEHRETLIRLMEGVEDIPGSALAEGLTWEWESFPEFLDVVDGLPHDVDVAMMVPHGPLRVNAMGQRGVEREPATAADIAKMSCALEEAVRAGALGFSTSRTMLHRTADGDATPMLGAAADELVGVATGMKRGGGGVFEMVSDFMDLDDEFGALTRVVRESGCGATFSLLQSALSPTLWRRLLEETTAANQEGLAIRAQVMTRPIGIVMGLEASLQPFMSHPGYAALASLPRADRVRRLKDPAVRAQILSETPTATHPFFAAFGGRHDRYFPLDDPPTYEPAPDSSIAHRAARAGVSPHEAIYDALVAEEGKAMLFFPFANYEGLNLDDVREMMTHPHAVFGLGDGGAHVGIVCDASTPTTTLAHWGRDRPNGRLPLEWLVRFLTRRPAETVGLGDRGFLEVGQRADVNVIDLDRLGVARPHVVYDLPAGGRRMLQRATGYDATLVAGVITQRHGEPTGALPGRLVRGRRKAVGRSVRPGVMPTTL